MFRKMFQTHQTSKIKSKVKIVTTNPGLPYIIHLEDTDSVNILSANLLANTANSSLFSSPLPITYISSYLFGCQLWSPAQPGFEPRSLNLQIRVLPISSLTHVICLFIKLSILGSEWRHLTI